MSEPKCPRWGEPCIKHECAFYDKVPATGEFECRDKLRNLYLDDIARCLIDVLRSSEQHREVDTQFIKSGLERGPTPELLRMVGSKEVT